ncbi:MAG: MarR family winged helix-turn-helix transcriptional regulator [Actinomycetota bacterium]|nr:MarR family winged helix-turn-helix transcriptional regulator [Actinomycetota bacterium]
MSPDPHHVARRIADECIGQRTRQLGRLVSRIYDDALRPHGVTNAQVGMLTAIEMVGPVRPTILGRIVGAEKSTVSRNVRGLVDRGWVQVRDDAEERGKLLELTPEGRGLLVLIFPAWEQAQGKAVALVGPRASETLSGYLREVQTP